MLLDQKELKRSEILCILKSVDGVKFAGSGSIFKNFYVNNIFDSLCKETSWSNKSIVDYVTTAVSS